MHPPPATTRRCKPQQRARAASTLAAAGVAPPAQTARVSEGCLAGRHPRGWEVPGGGVDQGETPQQAAVREAGEETGFDVSNVSLILHIEQRVHLFIKNAVYY